MSATDKRVSELAAQGWEVVSYVPKESTMHYFLMRNGANHKLLYYQYESESVGGRYNYFYRLHSETDF